MVEEDFVVAINKVKMSNYFFNLKFPISLKSMIIP